MCLDGGDRPLVLEPLICGFSTDGCGAWCPPAGVDVCCRGFGHDACGLLVMKMICAVTGGKKNPRKAELLPTELLSLVFVTAHSHTVMEVNDRLNL